MKLNPIALQLGPVNIYWYGLMYFFAFVYAYFNLKQRKINCLTNNNQQFIDDALFYACLGLILGGRLGYLLFYSFSDLFVNYGLNLLAIWQPGRSFHGALLGAILSLSYFAKQQKIRALNLFDFLVPAIPIGLGLGRLGNFINQELHGRITTMPWGTVFTHIDEHLRHPSALYEGIFEGLVLHFLLKFYIRKPQAKISGKTTGLFLFAYGIIRFSLEFYREPDWQLGYLLNNWLTMGQVLSLPMIAIGAYLLFRDRHAKLS